MSGTDQDGEAAGPESTFGARFLAEYRRLGGALAPYSWAELQEIKLCDREGLIRKLRSIGPGISWAAIQRIRSVRSPEELAEAMWRQRQAEAEATATSFWMTLALLQ